MAYIQVISVTKTTVRVRLAGLDTSYNGTTRHIRWEAWYSNVYLEDVVEGTIPNGASSSPTVTLSGLAPGFTYDIVCKVSNITGSDDLWFETSVTTDEDIPIPDAPSYIRVTEATYNSLSVEWDDSDYANNYELFVDGEYYGTYSTTSAIIIGLSPNTTYRVCVQAYNSSGTSSKTCASFTTLEEPDNTRPEIGNVLATQIQSNGNIYVKVTWSAYDNKGISHFWAYNSPPNDETYVSVGVELPGSTRSYTFTTDANGNAFQVGNTYYFMIRAVDEAGNISYQEDGQVSITISPNPPSAPTGLEVLSATERTLSFKWDPVPDAEGYKMYLNEAYAGTWTDTLVVFGDLQPNTSYTFCVLAYNEYGESERTCITTSTLPTQRPSAPGYIEVTDKTTTTLTVSWTAVDEADYYKLYLDNEFLINVYGSTTYTIRGLTPNTLYYVCVSSYNQYGESYEKACTATVLPGPPDIPELEVSVVGNDRIIVRWDSIDNADGYYLYLNNSFHGTVNDNGDSYYNYIFDNLQPETEYTLCIRAYNENGTSGSSCITVTTTNSQATLEVTEVTTTTISVEIINLEHDEDEYNFFIFHIQGGDIEDAFSGLTSYHTFTDLTPGVEYTITAYAVYGGKPYYVGSVSVTTYGGSRPNNWEWSYNITPGGELYSYSSDNKTAYLMPASEWNEFTDLINQFRNYKGLSNYNFTQASSSLNHQGIKTCINEAISAINDMLSSGQMDLLTDSDYINNASIFINLRDKLNSIE